MGKYKQAPNIYALEDLVEAVGHNQTEINGKWLPTRALGLDAVPNRIRAAWLVFTGKADVVIWPGGQ